MIFDAVGLPRDNGATDYEDSARLAGLMVLFRWPIPVDLSKYVVLRKAAYLTDIIFAKFPEKIGMYVRHPYESKYDFSRDQAICLIAGLKMQDRMDLINRKFIHGKDWLSPSHIGFINICKGEKASWFQKLWFWFDVLWNAFVSKHDVETNQLICMLLIYDHKYLRFWLKYKKQWQDTIFHYWCGWRDEPELAYLMVRYLENIPKEY